MPTLSSATALVAYAETLFQDGRVLLVGSSAGGLAELLLARGARSVHVCDPDAARALGVRQARQVEIVVEALTERAPTAAGFDLVIVEDLNAIKDPTALVRRAKKSMARRGAALIGCYNSEAESRLTESGVKPVSEIDYYSLYDTVADEFPVVRMLGQAPFVGYAVADFAPDEAPVPSVDTTLLEAGAEQPESFVALASFEPIKLDLFSLIQLPLSDLKLTAGSTSGPNEALRQLSEELSRVQAESQALRLQSEKAVQELVQARARAGEAESLSSRREARIPELESKVRESESKAQGLESKVRESESKARELESKLRESESKAQGLESKVRESESKARELESKARELESKVCESDAKALRILELEAQSAAQVDRLAVFERVEEVDATQELSRFEGQLREQSTQVQRLEAELNNSRTVGRALALSLEEQEMARMPVGGEASPRLLEITQQLAEAQQQAALREADYQVLLWTVEQLEQKLGVGVHADKPTQEAAAGLTQRQAALAHQLKAEFGTS